MIRQLKEENPFAKEKPGNSVNQKLQISCESLTMVVPESCNLADNELFNNHDINKIVKEKKSPVLNGFSHDQLSTWNNAGFILSIAPVKFWNTTIKELSRLQADSETASKLNIYKSSKEFSDLAVSPPISSEQMTLTDYYGVEKQYDLTNGEYVFRFHSTISGLQQLDTNTVNFFLIPVFKEFTPTTPLTALINTTDPVIGYEQLILNGTIKNDYMLAITCSLQAIDNDLPAAKMLFNKNTRGISVILLAPCAKTVDFIESNIPESDTKNSDTQPKQ